MRTVWKYEIPIEKEFELELPFAYKPVSLMVLYGKPYMWAIVDTEDVKYKAKFGLFWTGEEVPQFYDYIGTFEYAYLMYHLFVDYRESKDES